MYDFTRRPIMNKKITNQIRLEEEEMKAKKTI